MSAVNKTIHEAMGLCWHEINGFNFCPNCQMTVKVPAQIWPDYTSPVHYCELMDWMGHKERFAKFLDFLVLICGMPILLFLNAIRQEQVNLIAEAIEAGVLK